MGERVVLCKSCSTNLEIEDDYWAELGGGAFECPHCGAPIKVPTAADRSAKTVVPLVEQAVAPKRDGLILGIIAAAAILLAALLIFICLQE